MEEEIKKTHKTSGNEIAILRKTVHALIHGDPIPEEFEAYHAEAERKKAFVKERLNGV